MSFNSYAYSAAELTARIQQDLDGLERWRGEQLSLDAGWGIAGAAVGRVFRPWMYSMSADFYPHARVHACGEQMDELEDMAIDLARGLYHAEYVDLHALSGGSANSILICALTSPGDTIMSLPEPLGHRSMRADGIGGYLDRRFVPLPLEKDGLSLDTERCRELILREKPRLILLGSALYLFYEPFRQIAEAARQVGAITACDVSHTFGYLYCSMSVNPLEQGIDVIAGGTYKTVCGPNKGMICTNREDIALAVREHAPRMVFNYNAFLIPALAQALVELRSHGEEYGCTMIRCAKALAAAMEKEGFAIAGACRGYTDTHLLAAVMEGTDRMALVRKLESANILCSTVPLDESHFYLRPATMILARRGFLEEDMPMIAGLLADVVFHDNVELVREKVKALMSMPEHQKVYFAQE